VAELPSDMELAGRTNLPEMSWAHTCTESDGLRQAEWPQCKHLQSLNYFCLLVASTDTRGLDNLPGKQARHENQQIANPPRAREREAG